MRCIKKYHTLPKEIFSANLDYPNDKDSEKLILHVSGWVLKAKDVNVETRIKVKIPGQPNSDQIYETPLVIERKDVIDKILKGDSDNNATPGFSTIIPLTEQVNVYITLDDKEFLWCEITLLNDIETDKLKIDWHSLNSVDDKSSTYLPLSQVVKSWLINTCEIFYDLSQTQVKFSLSLTEKEAFDSFIERVLRWDFVLELCQYKERGYIRSCFNNSPAKIVGNISSGNLNIIKINDNDRIYYILQNASSCDGIFLPTSNKLFCLSHLTLNEYRAFIDIIHLFPCATKQNEFGGYLTYFNRPYHYMYDMLLGYYYAYSHGLLNKNDITVSKPGSDFLNFSKMFSLVNETKNLSDFSEIKDKIYLRIGVNFGNGANDFKKKNYIKMLDAYILDTLTDVAPHNHQDDTYSIWFGITSQKRSWIEQVDAISYIINNIQTPKSKLRIVIDGWTAPHTKNNVDEKEINSDATLVAQIKSGISREIELISVVGATIEEKISIASSIDIFVANYSTGSLNVARICNKNGIGHISSAFIDGASEQHIHNKTVIVNHKDVIDIPSSKGIDHFSYSIKKETMFDMVQGLIKDIYEDDCLCSIKA